MQELDARLGTLLNRPDVEVFPLDDAMLARAVTLSTLNLDLKPFDQAILAAILVRAETFKGSEENDVCFCELDANLQPGDKHGAAKQPLTGLYESAGLWVYGDFSMEAPTREPLAE